MKTKPFDIDKAKAGNPVCTRDLRPARIICYDQKVGLGNEYLTVLVSDADGYEMAYTYRKDGTFMGAGEQHRLDLQLATVKKTGWVNLYRDRITDSVVAYSAVYDTSIEANRYISCKDDEYHVATVRITWEE